jgi:hypothetical protein
MAYNYDDDKIGGNWIKLAVGEEIELDILGMEKATGKYNLKSGDEDLGWYLAVKTDKGTLNVNTLGLYYTFKENKIQTGMKIKLKYVKKGTIGNPSKYDLKIIGDAEQAPF